MYYKRLIPVLLYKHGHLVRSARFNVHQVVGDPIQQTNRYKSWDLDELIYLDISSHWPRTGSYNKKPFIGVVKEISKHCFVPLSVGGGIRTLEDIRELLHAGADRVIINSYALENPDFIYAAAETFGSQAIIISIDAKPKGNDYEVVAKGGQVKTNMMLSDWVSRVGELGAGEIFLNSIAKDGLGTGYDIEMISFAVRASTIPIISCGGASTVSDFVESLDTAGVAAVAAANLFHFTETPYYYLKQGLINAGVEVRPVDIIGSDFVSIKPTDKTLDKTSDNLIWESL